MDILGHEQLSRIFIETKIFSSGLDDLVSKNKIMTKDFEELQIRLLKNPSEGDLLEGTGGIRKTRLKSSSKGKSGGFRVIYLDLPKKEKIIFLAIFGKNIKENLSKEDKVELKKLAEWFKKE